MALTIETSKPTGHFRSTSLPSSTHPLSTIVADHRTRLKSSQEAASSCDSLACQKLGDLGALYDSLDDWLHLPLIPQDLSLEDERIRIEDLLDGCLKLVDDCGDVRDFFSQMKDKIQELQSSIRRRRGVEEASISRKKLSKVIIKVFREPEKDAEEQDTKAS